MIYMESKKTRFSMLFVVGDKGERIEVDIKLTTRLVWLCPALASDTVARTQENRSRSSQGEVEDGD